MAHDADNRTLRLNRDGKPACAERDVAADDVCLLNSDICFPFVYLIRVDGAEDAVLMTENGLVLD